LNTKAAATAAAFLLAASIQTSGATTILAKPGATFESRAVDKQRCLDAAQHALVTDVPPEHPHPPLSSMAVGSAACLARQSQTQR